MFSLFFFPCPPEERKNPDWPDLTNYLIHSILIGQRPVIQNHKALLTFIFNKADKSIYHFEIIQGETRRSLEENGIKVLTLLTFSVLRIVYCTVTLLTVYNTNATC